MPGKALPAMLVLASLSATLSTDVCPTNYFRVTEDSTACAACFDCSSKNAVITSNCTNSSDTQCDCAPGHINTGLYGVCPGLIFDPNTEKELVGCDGCISLYGQDLS
eukprot:2685063-Rhodomonas_salina.1